MKNKELFPYFFNKIAPRGSMLFYALLFTPKEQRAAIITIHAFYQEIFTILRTCQTQTVAQKKIEYWQQEWQNFRNQQAQHPITQYLTQVNQNYPLNLLLFEQQLEEASLFVEKPGFARMDDLILHCHHSASLREILKLHILKPQEVNAEHFKMARDWGVFFRIVEMIKDFGADLRKGQCYIPLEMLEEQGIAPEEFQRYENTPKFSKLFKLLAEVAMQHYEKALLIYRHEKSQPLEPLYLLAVSYLKLLQVIEADQFNVIERMYALPPLRQFFNTVYYHFCTV